jgi:hypothetical protein
METPRQITPKKLIGFAAAFLACFGAMIVIIATRHDFDSDFGFWLSLAIVVVPQALILYKVPQMYRDIKQGKSR